MKTVSIERFEELVEITKKLIDILENQRTSEYRKHSHLLFADDDQKDIEKLGYEIHSLHSSVEFIMGRD